MPEKKTKYGLLLPNGELAYLWEDDYGGFTLSDSGREPWLVDSLKEIENTLFDSISVYNSEWDCPSWGGYSRDDLTPVAVVTEITPVSVELPVNIEDVFFIRDITKILAKRYARRDLDEGNYVFCVVNYSVDEMTQHVGRAIHFGSRYNRKLVIAAIPIPDEYTDLIVEERGWDASKPGCCLIAKTLY